MLPKYRVTSDAYQNESARDTVPPLTSHCLSRLSRLKRFRIDFAAVYLAYTIR